MGDGRRSRRIPPSRIDLPRPNLGPDSHCSTAAAGTHTAARNSIAERNNCVSVSGSGASPRLRCCRKHLRLCSLVAAALSCFRMQTRPAVSLTSSCCEVEAALTAFEIPRS